MDMMGGGECYEEGLVDKRKIVKGKKGFNYHWEQISFNPINADASFAISFKFADGSKLKMTFRRFTGFFTAAAWMALIVTSPAQFSSECVMPRSHERVATGGDDET